MPTNGEIGRITCDCFNTREFDRSLQYLDENIVWTEMHNGVVFRGHRQVIGEYEAWVKAFPDGHAEVQQIIDAGDRVIVEMIVTGTNTGPSLGPNGTTIPPTGKFTRMALCDVMEFRNGKVVGGRTYATEMPEA